MTISYIDAKTSRLYESSTGSSKHVILIYGDEVNTLRRQQNNRVEVQWRTRTGWIDKDDLRTEPVLEVYFIDVGQGDSTFIVTPGRKKILIDGGMDDRALGFIAWKYRLWEIDQNSPIIIDLLVMTHADEDHIGGLIPIISHPKIKIKKIIHNGQAVFESGFQERLGDLITQDGEKYLITRHNALDELDDDKLSEKFRNWKKAIMDEGDIDYHAVDSTTGEINIGDRKVTLEVLGPRLDRRSSDDSKIYRWFRDHAHTINGHSTVLRLTYGNVKFLLSGDINIPGSRNLLQDPDLAASMDAHVLKAPHHGSHEFSRPWLNAVNPQISVISSGDNPDHGHPRAKFLAAIGNVSRANSLVFSTKIARNFREVGEKLQQIKLTPEEMRNLPDSALEKFRRLFKRRLHGMINVRTDGNEIYAARRVASAHWWESYGPVKPASRSI